MLRALLVGCALSIAAPARADCYAWPLRGDLAYDGDTIYLTIPELPPELRDVSGRLLNIDAPELEGKCAGERILAIQARDELRAMLAAAQALEVCPIRWDKYGGRIDVMVWADGVDVGEELVRRGLARPYDGGKRASWCE